MMSWNRVLIFFLFLILSSCSNKKDKLNFKDYNEWLEKPENGLHKLKNVSGIFYDLQYIPDTAKNKSNISIKIIKFILKISIENSNTSILKYKVQNNIGFDQRIQYYTSEFKNDIVLTINNKKIKALDVLFERSYDLKPYETFILIFEIDNNIDQKEMTISINDKILNNGIVNFKYTESVIKIIPQLSE